MIGRSKLTQRKMHAKKAINNRWHKEGIKKEAPWDVSRFDQLDIPGYEYIYVECGDDDTFSKTIKYLEDHSIPLAGAVHDFTCPQTGKNYMFFPIRKL